MAPIILAAVLLTTPQITVDPPQPRLGDPVAVYVAGVDHQDRTGAVEVFGYRFALTPVGRNVLRAVVAVPSDTTAGDHPLSVIHPGAEAWPPAKITLADRAFKTSHLKVAKKFTKKKRSKALQARLQREQRQIQQVWSSTPTAGLDLGQPKKPTKTALTGHYGTARVFNNERKSVHYGIDLNGRIGTPVYAAARGKVVLSSMRWGSGGTLVIDHGGGLYTLYFHLSKRRVRQGATVKRGQRIGDVGKSGRVTGPHLHFGVAIRAAYADGDRLPRGMYVDPEAFLSMTLGDRPPVQSTAAGPSQ